MPQGSLFVVSGPSGAGKGTLVARLLSAVTHAWVSVSATTRPPRKGEVPGQHYYFVSVPEFQRLIQTDGLLEWACYAGNYYGTPRATVEDHLIKGDHVILEIEVQGAFQVREKMPSAHLIFIEPPSLEALEKRLRLRGTESDERIAARMKSAKVELSHKMEYDTRLVNDDIDKATEELVRYVVEQAQKTRG